VSEIKLGSFRGGVFPLHEIHGGKDLTKDMPIAQMPAPDIAVYPMAQHIGAPCVPNVNKGDRVLIGQEIGSMKGFVSAPIHASVSGEVVALEQKLTISGSPVLSVLVKNDGKDEWVEDIQERTPGEIAALSAQDIRAIVKKCGVVGLGGASFPTHIKITPPPDNAIDTIIINGAECEPYLTSDHRLMLEQPEKLIGGIKLIIRAIGGGPRAVIAVENNKKDAISLLDGLLKAEKNISVKALEVKYPQGSEKHLITSITKRQVPSGKLPASAGCLVVNVGTAIAIYDAVHHGRPIVDTVISATGDLNRPGVFLVRTGTPVQQVIDHCGGFKPDVTKVISGGPMMGISIYDYSVPIIKSTSSLLAMTDKHAGIAPQTKCLRCGRCVKACPMFLMPAVLNRLSVMQNWEEADRYNALDCVECGSCTYICPAKLNITSNIRRAKRAVMSARKRS
jgi:electron transport complex protein RnfC